VVVKVAAQNSISHFARVGYAVNAQTPVNGGFGDYWPTPAQAAAF